MRTLTKISAVIAWVAAAATATAQPQYQIFDIGVIQMTDNSSQGFGASPGGVAVGRSVQGTSVSQAFTWTQGGGLVGLPSLAGRNHSVSNSANDNGVVVGTAATTLFGSSRLPVIWHNGAVSQLPLPAGETLGDANSVNASGVAVGSVDGGSLQQAVIYNGGTATVITQVTQTGCFFVTAFGINNSGRIVGTGIDPNNAARNVGMLYQMGGGIAYEVGALPGANGALAFAVSNNGHVVGSSMMNQGSGMPFIYTDTAGMIAIPLATGTSQGSARGVNSAGSVVGIDSSAFSIPFLWDGATTYRVADLLPAGSGWDLASNTSSSALGISDNGVIVGTGMHNGNLRAYAMVPTPGPAAHFQVVAPTLCLFNTPCSFTIAARDQFNNTATGYTGTVHFTSTDGSANLPADGTLTNGTGTRSVTFHMGGGQTITATDTVNGSVTGTSDIIQVVFVDPTPTPRPATHFLVTAPSFAVSGTPFNFTVTAQDSANQTVTGYAGLAHFTSSDPSATLPSNSTLTNGTGTFQATLNQMPTQTITATDTVNGSITGTSNPISIIISDPTPTPTPTPGITLVDRLSDARASAVTMFSGVDNPPPQIQTDFLPAHLSNSAMASGESGAASGHCTSNSSIVADNSMGTLQVTGDGSSSASAILEGAVGSSTAKLIVISFTLTDRTYSYSLTGQLSANDFPGFVGGVATAKLTAGSTTIFAVVANAPPAVTLSQIGMLQPGDYTLSVDVSATAHGSFAGGHEDSRSSANFNFVLGPAPTPTPTATATPPIPPIDLAVNMTDAPDPVQVGQNLTYTITVSNNVPDTALNVTMTDALPPGVNYVSATPSQGSCTGTSTVTCNLGAIQGSANATITLVVTPTVAGQLSNTANVPYPGDPNPSNNSSTQVTTVISAETPTPTPSPTATPTPTPSPTPAAQAVNLSTRMRVQTGTNVGIGGFIITGSAPRHVLLRAIGPSLAQFGVPNVLADPVLEFGTLTNDNWRDDPAQEALIIATGIPPTDNLESAIYATLNPGHYTALVSGKNNTSGVGLVEVYDLNPGVDSKLANLSTRAFVDTGNNVVIAGFILGGDNGNDRIVLRGIGPSLAQFGVPNPLADPTLELRDSNGALLLSNNDWQDNAAPPGGPPPGLPPELAPGNPLESVIVATLSPGLYTALLMGRNGGTGVGLVEVYDLGP